MSKFPFKLHERYFVTPEKGIVVCKTEATRHGIVVYTAEGKARTSPTDTFDEIKGKRLASLRARRKIAAKVYNTLADVVEAYEAALEDLDEYYESIEDRLDDLMETL